MRGWVLIALLAVVAIGLWTWRVQSGYGTGFEVEIEGDLQGAPEGDNQAPLDEYEMNYEAL